MKDTIIDYVHWRGDISFQIQPYNSIDYLILSNLAYVHFDGITFEPSLTLNEAYEQYINSQYVFEDESHSLFEKVSHAPRYQNIRILSYMNDVNPELIKQFAVVTFLLENQTLFVAFRGTDESLIGWHEDFLMLCETIIPSQTSAVNYLNEIGQFKYQSTLKQSLQNQYLGSLTQRLRKHFIYKKQGLPILLGGHSKGGNLAMYAACFCDENLSQRILKVYNFDGPGFQEDMLTSKNYQNMLPRIISYIPHYSFFGIVLGHEENYHVIQSHNEGMLQHNSFSWHVTKDDFVNDELSYESVQFAIKVILFLEKMTIEEKRLFVETMFGLFDSLNLHTFHELSHITYKQILAAIKELTLLDNKMRKMLIEVLHMLWLEAKKTKKG